jgi:membrane-associated phospholipid phosphatase
VTGASSNRSGRGHPVDPAASSEPGSKLAESALDAVQQAVAPDSTELVQESAVAVDLPAVAPRSPTTAPIWAAMACGMAGLMFLVLAVSILRQGGSSAGLDAWVHRWVLEHRHSGDLALARAVTWGGSTEVVIPGLVLVGTLAGRGGRNLLRRFQTGLLVTCVASAGIYLGLLVNHAVDRARPPAADWAGTAGGPAFPSGHTTAATVFAAGCTWVLLGRYRTGWRRRLVWTGAVTTALLVGWSRVWLGVHWPSDVVGGWLLGTAWSVAAVLVVQLLRRRPGPGTGPDRGTGRSSPSPVGPRETSPDQQQAAGRQAANGGPVD